MSTVFASTSLLNQAAEGIESTESALSSLRRPSRGPEVRLSNNISYGIFTATFNSSSRFYPHHHAAIAALHPCTNHYVPLQQGET